MTPSSNLEHALDRAIKAADNAVSKAERASSVDAAREWAYVASIHADVASKIGGLR